MASTRIRSAQTVRLPKPPSAAQRNKQATQGIVSALSATDEKAAVTAALEFVNERLAWDSSMRSSVRQRYDELASLAMNTTRTTKASTPAPLSTARETNRNTTLERLDPYQALEDFGADRLRLVLGNDTQRRLRTAVDAVQARNPDSKPKGRTRIADMVDYIMEHVAPGY